MTNWISGIAGWMLLSVFGMPQAQDSGLAPALREMVETERAFARTSVQKGVRDSFLAYFAPDGIVFRPHPIRLQEDYQNRPVPVSPPQAVLNWSPIYGDIAASQDLGYDTCPYVVEDHSPENRPSQHGLFFSVWRKQANGNWRVVLDVGVATPRAVAPLDEPFRAASSGRMQSSSGSRPPHDRPDLRELEQRFLESARSGTAGAYREILSKQARIHRFGEMPIVGKDAIETWLASQTAPLSGEPQFDDVSDSGDLGYTYGSYQLGEESGYYAHVWKLESDGAWRIVMDVTNPLPSS